MIDLKFKPIQNGVVIFYGAFSIALYFAIIYLYPSNLLYKLLYSMFSSKNQLLKRTPENGTDRENFLSLLVDEFLHSSSYDAKCQVLANLANFSYDPINYGYIRDVGVLDIFLHVLKNEADEKLVRFAIAGLCNLCPDPENAQYILNHLGIKPIKALLGSDNSDIVADTITTLIYLHSEQTNTEINTIEVVKFIKQLTKSDDKKLVNIATIFLQDVCETNDTM